MLPPPLKLLGGGLPLPLPPPPPPLPTPIPIANSCGMNIKCPSPCLIDWDFLFLIYFSSSLQKYRDLLLYFDFGVNVCVGVAIGIGVTLQSFMSKFSKHSYLSNRWQGAFHIWNTIISKRNRSSHNTISLSQTLGWGLGVKNWSATLNVKFNDKVFSIFGISATTSKIRGQKMGHTHFKFLDSFLNIYMSAATDKTFLYLKHNNHIIA